MRKKANSLSVRDGNDNALARILNIKDSVYCVELMVHFHFSTNNSPFVNGHHVY